MAKINSVRVALEHIREKDRILDEAESPYTEHVFDRLAEKREDYGIRMGIRYVGVEPIRWFDAYPVDTHRYRP